MAPRNQNRPPRSPFGKKDGAEDAPLDKRRRVGAGRMAPVDTGRGRRALAVANKQDVVVANSGVESVEGSECSVVEFTREEVEALLNEKLKGKKFDVKGNMERMGEQIKKLKLCIKWFQQVDESHRLEQEKLKNELELAAKNCLDTELKMRIKEEELNALITDLRKQNDCLQEKVAKEESDKLDAIDRHRREQEGRVAAEKLQASLSEELAKTQAEKNAANLKAATLSDTYKNLQEYNTSLHQYNSKLQTDLASVNDSLKRVEKEKLAIVENLSTLRGHCSSLQEQLTSSRASQDEAIKQKDSLATEIKCLRGEIQQLRDDRDHHVNQVHTLTADILKYKEATGKSFTELDSLTIKSNALEERCSSQMEQIRVLKIQLEAANEKLKMTDLSSMEMRTEFEKQNTCISELKNQLTDLERQLAEGEIIRKKLHNTILELKGNIRVFCRVRPFLSEEGAGVESSVISYPTSTESLGRGIDVIQSGAKHAFTFDKVFANEASQKDVFEEISQLVQSALDGYKVCIFAYGQTGSGKTYTMMGRPEAPDHKGLIPRSLEQIFQTSQSLASQGWRYTMQASMLEIYNETIRDLLSNRSSFDATSTESGVAGKQCEIKHDANKNPYVPGLTIIDVCSIKEISSLLQQAAKSRSVGKTNMNEHSSRSHFVFTLRISGINESTDQRVHGVLNLIDLAGSERLSKSGATGDRQKETVAINSSLSALGDVIFSLSKKEGHVPFRNSKLTHLLQPYLGGDSKALMVVNVSPDPSSVGESLCSLRFAARVNACEVGIPRRQTSMQFSDNRLSCG